MATKNWNNDFMTKVLEEAAWKELSNEHPLCNVPACGTSWSKTKRNN